MHAMMPCLALLRNCTVRGMLSRNTERVHLASSLTQTRLQATSVLIYDSTALQRTVNAKQSLFKTPDGQNLT
jgi:hypothetical protein